MKNGYKGRSPLGLLGFRGEYTRAFGSLYLFWPIFMAVLAVYVLLGAGERRMERCA
jgi:hypothetical protein